MQRPASCPDPQVLRSAIEGRIASDDEAALNEHLDGCERCRGELERLADEASWLLSAARRVGSDDEPTPALNDVIEKLKSSSTELHPTVQPAAAPETFDFLAPSNQPGCIGQLGRYEIIKFVGRGGMGLVFKGFDRSLRRSVAIKVLDPRKTSDAVAVKRFLREARAAAAINHKYVVTIHEIGQFRGLPFLVMTYVSGVSLEEHVSRGGPLKVDEVVRIGSQIAAGLAAAHARGLVHRDVKPANVLLERGSMRVKLTDFGLAQAMGDLRLTQTGFMAGTPSYAAPEQASGRPIDHRADLFALGSVLYFMCTGKLAFAAASPVKTLEQVCNAQPQPVGELNREVPSWLAAIVERLHAKEPAQRFGSAKDVAKALTDPLSSLEVVSAANSPAIAPSQGLSYGLIGGVGAAIAMLVLIAIAMFNRPNPSGIAANEPHRAQPQAGKPAAPGKPREPVPTPPAARAGPSAFLIERGSKGVRVGSLAEAVDQADNGERIVVEGNGPFACEPARVFGKRLTIRAADGFRPVLTFAQPPGQADAPMLECDGPLTLEGLEFHLIENRSTAGPPVDPMPAGLVRTSGPELLVANCRFVVVPGRECIVTSSPRCELRHCEFLSINGIMVSWNCVGPGNLTVENCVQSGGAAVVVPRSANGGELAIELTHNTFTGFLALHLIMDRGGLPAGPRPTAPAPVVVNAVGNLFDPNQGLVSIDRPGRPNARPGADLRRPLPSVMRWVGRNNLYSQRGRPIESPDPFETKNSGSVWDNPRYSAGELIYSPDALAIPEYLDARDFALAPDSPGKGAAADGSDIGANASRVGPGARRIEDRGLRIED